MEPLVSIGMTVWNCEKTLKPALHSIVNQTYQNWELLLIDDGSSDCTLAIARSFQDPRIQIIVDGLHKNLPTRLNQAVALGRGKYFARMDGDDIAYPNCCCGNQMGTNPLASSFWSTSRHCSLKRMATNLVTL